MKLKTLSLAAGFLALSIAGASAMPLCGLGQICKVPNGVGQLQPVNPKFTVNPELLKPIKTPPVVLPVGPLPVPPKPVNPGPDVGIHVHLGGDGYAGGYGPDSGDYVSCGEARQIVRSHGYKKVKTQDCSEGDYTFLGKRKGKAWIIEVSDSGDIINVDRAF
jgi:hypothetical protein